MNRAAILLLVIATTAMAEVGEIQTRFTEACRAYEKGEYPLAASEFQALIEMGSATAAVHYNLANTHFKQDKMGWAVRHYRKAIELNPGDRDARANLEYVRSVIQQGTPRRPPLLSQWSAAFSLDVWTMSAAAAATLWLLLTLGCQIYTGWKESLSAIRPILGFLAILLSVATVGVHHQQSSDTSAVITAKSVEARFGPIEESAAAFTLRDGTEIEVLGMFNGWCLVRESGQREGWMPADALQSIGRQARLLTASE
ncbi:MAG: tetratricopeptide repeat protein [Pedosphaera sp.]|nr:tetratricopeptide repeat protein [Pedosphaera sp.]